MVMDTLRLDNARCPMCGAWPGELAATADCRVCGWDQSKTPLRPSNIVKGIDGHVIRDKFPNAELLDNVFHGRPVRLLEGDNPGHHPPKCTWGKTGKLLWTAMGPFAAFDYWAVVELDEPVYEDVEGECSRCQRLHSSGTKIETRYVSCHSSYVEPLEGKRDW